MPRNCAWNRNVKAGAKSERAEREGRSESQKWKGRVRGQKRKPKVKGQSERAEAEAKSERAEWELKIKLPPFSTYIFFSMVFFLCVFFLFLLRKKKMLGESTRNRSAKVGGQKREPKVKGQSRSLKVSSIPSLGFLFVVFLCVLFSMCLRRRRQW